MSFKSNFATASQCAARPNTVPGRRTFLKSGAALSALAGGTLVPSLTTAQTRLAVPEWMKEQGSPVLTAPYGMPSSFEKHVVRRYRIHPVKAVLLAIKTCESCDYS